MKNVKRTKPEKALAHAIENNKISTNELNVCNDSITCLKLKNVDLDGKIKELNSCHGYTSSVEHVYICNRW
jgi:hypothetical protein